MEILEVMDFLRDRIEETTTRIENLISKEYHSDTKPHEILEIQKEIAGAERSIKLMEENLLDLSMKI